VVFSKLKLSIQGRPEVEKVGESSTIFQNFENYRPKKKQNFRRLEGEGVHSLLPAHSQDTSASITVSADFRLSSSY